MSDVDARFEALEERIRVLEDTLAIYQLMMRYGPAVDSGSSVATGQLWTENGEYDAGMGAWTGPAAIGGMVEGAQHQSFIHNGSAHIVSIPMLEIDGDKATATCYSQLILQDTDDSNIGGIWPGGGRPYRIQRVTANTWELVKTSGGWRVDRRVNRVLDGTDEARRIFREATARTSAHASGE